MANITRANVVVFPTDVGMNRVDFERDHCGNSVPHGRGDEP